MQPGDSSWRRRPCKHCGGGHFDSTCTRSDIPHKTEHAQKILKQQERHSIKIDQDGDVVMDEWTKCVYCVSKLSCLVAGTEVE
jgi:hypothetical protein